VNKSRTQKLHDCKRRIERRLDPNKGSVKRDKPMIEGANIHYEISEKTKAISSGGIGLLVRLAIWSGLREAIDKNLHLLKVHLPYHESDHVLSIALNALAGGTCLEDIEHRRNDENFLNALGAERIPDPTTAGDFCRRFTETHIVTLMETINEIRTRIWSTQPREFFQEAILDVDGTLVDTFGECKEGMEISYKGEWGYQTLLLSLANTGEPLYLKNRSGNRPSHEGAAPFLDRAIRLCWDAGFREVTVRGDTDFSMTEHLDRWHEDNVRFVFGYDCRKNLVEMAGKLPETVWQKLERPSKYERKTDARSRPENVVNRIVTEREFKKLLLKGEEVAEFSYRPRACKRTYRMVVLRKNISVEKGEQVLFDEIRYHFYITNDGIAHPSQIVFDANQRCDQENLIGELKNGVRALHAPVNGLVSNWAYMVMASLAWTLKAWMALLLPEGGRWKVRRKAEKTKVLRMGFRTFLNALMLVPAQIVRRARRIEYRFLSWNRWLPVFFRAWDRLRRPLLE